MAFLAGRTDQKSHLRSVVCDCQLFGVLKWAVGGMPKRHACGGLRFLRLSTSPLPTLLAVIVLSAISIVQADVFDGVWSASKSPQTALILRANGRN